MNDIQASMKRFSKYLSAFCNVRRGHAIQNYARKNLDEYTKSLRIRKKHQEDIRKRRACLAEDYGIATRSGAHCAPLMHKALGTETTGLVRFSFSHFNTPEEVDTAIEALKELRF
jgi:selenocysteine lyase/cysteine desulfurase